MLLPIIQRSSNQVHWVRRCRHALPIVLHPSYQLIGSEVAASRISCELCHGEGCRIVVLRGAAANESCTRVASPGFEATQSLLGQNSLPDVKTAILGGSLQVDGGAISLLVLLRVVLAAQSRGDVFAFQKMVSVLVDYAVLAQLDLIVEPLCLC